MYFPLVKFQDFYFQHIFTQWYYQFFLNILPPLHHTYVPQKSFCPSLQDAGGYKPPVRTRGSGCFHVIKHRTVQFVLQSVTVRRQVVEADWSPISSMGVNCSGHFLIEVVFKKTWETSVKSTNKRWGSLSILSKQLFH